MKRTPQQAMALVITLIMLSLITIVAVAFLAVSRRDRASVTQAANITDSELMADAARERAIAELAARVRLYVTSNGLVFRSNFCSLLVSTNIDTNIVGNLQYDPRVPVWVRTANGTDFRWRLDLDRNGQTNETGYLDTNGLPTTVLNSIVGFFVGDPHWIGILARPGLPHTNDNNFIGRYCYLAMPAGKALDINYIFNNILNAQLGVSGYVRREGSGSWDINLAAFLADLNPGAGWNDYTYLGGTGFPNQGRSFDSAQEFLKFRAGDPLFPELDSTNHFFSLHDFIRPKAYFPRFTKNLDTVLSRQDPFNRSTYYRLIEQLATDSIPEQGHKIHLNYINIDGIPVSDFVPWTATTTNSMGLVVRGPERFFHEVTDRLLRTEYTNNTNLSFSLWANGLWTNGIGIWTNNVFYSLPGIPICINGSTYTTNYDGLGNAVIQPLYSTRLHQLLQITANLYDATHTGLPAVFRPKFTTDGTNVSIVGYIEETGVNFITNDWISLDDKNNLANMSTNDNVFGIPLIMGARQGLPSFNELVLQNTAQVVRKLKLFKTDPASTNYSISNMFIIGISNTVGVEAWNSYQTAYTNPIVLKWMNHIKGSLNLSNYLPIPISWSTPGWTNSACITNISTWNGGAFMPSRPGGIVSQMILCNSILPSTNCVGDTDDFISNLDDLEIRLTVTNLFAFFLIDATSMRIIDAVSLYTTNCFNITKDLDTDLFRTNSPAVQKLWDPTPVPFWGTAGISNQIYIGLHADATSNQEWTDYNYDPFGRALNKTNGISDFQEFVYTTNSPNLTKQAPFNPVRKMWQTISWQVNDPLVHYRLEDLWDEPSNTNYSSVTTKPYKQTVNLWDDCNLGKLNRRYKPWAYDFYRGNDTPDVNDTELSVKDPGITSSDAWQFPTTKFPNIGWLGRVHRGTPWQTIYLKSTNALMVNWHAQNGAAFTPETHPTNDWKLVDYFTVAVNSNATRGQLSINQTNLAPWSAVLSAITVGTLSPAGNTNMSLPVEPAALFPEVGVIVAGINRHREKQRGMNIQFNRLGDILGTPELTVASPYLNPPFLTNQFLDELKIQSLTDRDYEAIPEQILSLLKAGDERFVIYAWGQSLKPAANSIVTSGGNFGLCTNYQITGEMATRTVVHFTTNNQAVIERFNIMPPE